jgi:hypothetical protein
MSDQTEASVLVSTGTWIGREQAFDTVARHCSAARVACLKQVRETEAYKTLNLTWEEFWPRARRDQPRPGGPSHRPARRIRRTLFPTH